MSGAASERDRLPNDAESLVPLQESEDDSHGTRMTYQEGTQTPLYVLVAWGLFLASYVWYQLWYLLPDLRAWFRVPW
jgi:hypothetical protein